MIQKIADSLSLSLSGRAKRKEFWLFTMVIFVICIIGSITMEFWDRTAGMITICFVLPIYPFWFTMLARRYNDIQGHERHTKCAGAVRRILMFIGVCISFRICLGILYFGLFGSSLTYEQEGEVFLTE